MFLFLDLVSFSFSLSSELLLFSSVLDSLLSPYSLTPGLECSESPSAPSAAFALVVSAAASSVFSLLVGAGFL